MTSWIFFIVLHTVSLGFAGLTLWRLYYYIRRYRFDESKYTLLFGFVHLRWIAMAYAALVVAWLPITYLLFALA